MILLIGCILLVVIGLYAIVTKRNLIKIAIGFCMIEYGINLLFAFIGFKKNSLAPIITNINAPKNFVDPIPQALVLTAIVIGLGTTAVMVSMIIRIYEKYKTLDINEIRKLKG
ncbi:MAG: NADH-quinone oxidoreductase subunit K [candidate division WOR-3 bacterium]|nr:NADH-quinone oxidoreductase subunit K [candidate division WOR-3 bacterium]